jgi:hypothetical protein
MSNVAAKIAALNNKTTVQQATQTSQVKIDERSSVPRPPQPPPPPPRVKDEGKAAVMQQPPPPPPPRVQPIKMAHLIANEKKDRGASSDICDNIDIKSKVLPGRGSGAMRAAAGSSSKAGPPLCYFFRHGKCVNGPKCKFDHRCVQFDCECELKTECPLLKTRDGCPFQK